MGFVDRTKERVIDWLGAASVTELEQRVSEAYERGFYDGNDDPATSTFKAGGQGYKRMSDRYVREGKIDFQRALSAAWDLWQKSPIAKRVLTMKRDHIIGHGAMPGCENEKALEVIRAFWMDNKLDKRASEFAVQLFGFGEQCYPVFVRQSDGRVRIGYIDPASVKQVVKNPNNAMEDWAVCVERMAGNGTMEKLVYRIIREDEAYVDDMQAVDSQYEGKLVTAEQATLEPWEAGLLAEYGLTEYSGSCFFAKVNAVSNQTRGMSDLLQVADWIDQADEVLFALADREQFAGYFAFDVTLVSGNDETIKKRSNEIRMNPPKKGSVNVHNDSETWMQWAPNLGQTGTIETFRAILGLILGGMGFPVHWFGYGDDANRATATVQADPTAKSLEHDQETIKTLFLTMCQFAVDQAIIAGAGEGLETEEYELDLNLPDVSAKDMSRVAASINALASAIATAQSQGWSSRETAVKLWANLLNELGVEVDPQEEMERIEAEEEEQRLADEQRRNDALKAMMDAGAAGPNGQRPGNGQVMPQGEMETNVND
jgi:hypothetical protein